MSEWDALVRRIRRLIPLAVALAESGNIAAARTRAFEAKVLLARLIAADPQAFGRPGRLGAWADGCLSRLTRWSDQLEDDE